MYRVTPILMSPADVIAKIEANKKAALAKEEDMRKAEDVEITSIVKDLYVIKDHLKERNWPIICTVSTTLSVYAGRISHFKFRGRGYNTQRLYNAVYSIRTALYNHRGLSCMDSSPMVVKHLDQAIAYINSYIATVE